MWGRIYQGEFFLWSIRAGYFADGFWNSAKPQYAVKIAVLGFLGTWAHLHLILRPPRLSDVSEVHVLGNQGPGPDCNPACVLPFTRPIQTRFWWLQIRLVTPTWVSTSWSSSMQAGFEGPLSVYVWISLTCISCCPASTRICSRLFMVAVPPTTTRLAFPAWNYQYACGEKPQWCRYNSTNKQIKKKIHLSLVKNPSLICLHLPPLMS